LSDYERRKRGRSGTKQVRSSVVFGINSKCSKTRTKRSPFQRHIIVRPSDALGEFNGSANESTSLAYYVVITVNNVRFLVCIRAYRLKTPADTFCTTWTFSITSLLLYFSDRNSYAVRRANVYFRSVWSSRPANGRRADIAASSDTVPVVARRTVRTIGGDVRFGGPGYVTWSAGVFMPPFHLTIDVYGRNGNSYRSSFGYRTCDICTSSSSLSTV